MMIRFLTCCILLPGLVHAQKITYDIFNFSAPKGWTRDEKSGLISYTTIDNSKATWCRLVIYKSTKTKGTLDADFNSEWADLVVKEYKVTGDAQLTDPQEEDGWKIKAGLGKFNFNSQPCIVMLTTISGYQRCASIVATTNDQSYLPGIQQFLESVQMNKPAGNNTNTVPGNNVQPKSVAVNNTGFGFNTTNFDDGWTSVVKDNWVEVTKGEIKILMHYPDPRTTMIADPEPQINNAWNILVAPRYSDLREYKTITTSLDYIRPYFGCGQLKDNSTGRQVFVAIFNKGNTGWMEFICADKNAFTQAFGMNPDVVDWNSSSDVWNGLVKMASYNKFAVAPSDLKGKWTSDFSGMLNYYNAYTGAHTATSIHQSSEYFEFGPEYGYSWKLIAINGVVGSVRYDNAANRGKFSVPNNWQVYFSNLEGKPKTFDAYFSCIKGGRILWLQDAKYPTGYTAYGLAK